MVADNGSMHTGSESFTILKIKQPSNYVYCPTGPRPEDRKATKYSSLPASHIFTSVAIETLGVVGPASLSFLKDLGCRKAAETGESRSTDYLLQRLSVAVQQGNSAAVRGGMDF